MHASVASGTKGNQVLIGIVARLATKFLVVNFKVRHRAARLASPAIAAQHLVAQLFVQLGIKPQGTKFWLGTIHDTFRVT